jgi:general secretion pathway protein C
MEASSSGARSRGPLIAGALAGVALVLAAVTAVVVLRRDPASAAAPGDVRLVASRTSAATLAAAVAGTPLRLDGGRLVATDPAALGLAPGDLVRTIGGVPVESAAAGRAMLRRLTRATPEALLFEVERGGAIAVVRVTIDGDRAALTAPRDPDGATAPDLSPALPPAAPTDPDVAAILAGVTKVDDTHVVVTRAAVDQLLANPMAVATGARVVPSVRAGVVDGFKLFAIRAGSLFAALGFANGDTIQRINGLALTSADRALEVYTKLRDAPRLEFELVRRGRPVTLTIEIR